MKYIYTETEAESPIHYRFPLKRVLYRGKSRFQKILVFDAPHHGRVMVLDNIVQLTTREEHFYHDSIVHPALQTLPNPRKVLIIGGGDGGTSRELAKYPSLESIVECELDEQVVNVAKKYFPSLAVGYKDKRVRLIYQDGYKFLRETNERFDAIIVDLTDPYGPTKILFEEPFYRLCSERLTEDGILCAQSESIYYNFKTVRAIYEALARVFPFVEWVVTPLAMYAGNYWTFSVASKRFDPTTARNSFVPETKYYMRSSHAWFFMPHALRTKLLARR